MKYYIALGGIGCRTLKDFSGRLNLSPKSCFYIDTDYAVSSLLDPQDQCYVIRNLPAGTGVLRQIGKNAVRYEIFTQQLYPFFREILQDSAPEFVILTSSFGGFGSSAAVEFADYLHALIWQKHRMPGVSCRIIAFSEGYCKKWGFPSALMEKFRLNTIDTVSELSAHSGVAASATAIISEHPVFNPCFRFYLIDTSDLPPNRFWSVPDKSDEELQHMDCRQTYLKMIQPRKQQASVFISYSSKDQKTADMLVDALAEKGIESWIATRSIQEGSYAGQIIQGIRAASVFVVLLSKNSIASEQVKNEIDRAFARLRDGLKIVPFIIDDAPLDDECSYYLCRQEFFFGKVPPVEARIEELVQKIHDMLT